MKLLAVAFLLTSAATLAQAPSAHLGPDSLYLQQLLDRLGPQAVRNIGY